MPLARFAQVTKIFASAERTGRTATEIARLERYRRGLQDFIKAGETRRQSGSRGDQGGG